MNLLSLFRRKPKSSPSADTQPERTHSRDRVERKPKRGNRGRHRIYANDHAKIAERYANGETVADIANAYGVTDSRIYQVLSGQGIKCRKAPKVYRPEQYAPCPECGGRKARKAACCYDCRIKAQRVWDRDGVIDALTNYYLTTGSVPTLRNWQKESSGRSDMPSTKTVVRNFGSWSEALIAAGMTPLPRSGRRSNSAR